MNRLPRSIPVEANTRKGFLGSFERESKIMKTKKGV